MIPQLSIIIPCFNSEKTLEETLQSVLNQYFSDWEAIIVNDGSKDNLEEIALKWVNKDSRFKYFKKENGGLGTARNYGILKAQGKFILPLDSDNKIRPVFALKALQIFNQNENIGVIYGNAMYFGEKEGIWEVGSFNIYKMLVHNYIDACSIIRKSVFDIIGHYDTNLPYQGHEDWDLWLSVINSPFDFYYLEEITFDYRVSNNSMIKSFDKKMLEDNIEYIQKKHFKLYVNAFMELLSKQKYIDKTFNNIIWLKNLKRKLKL